MAFKSDKQRRGFFARLGVARNKSSAISKVRKLKLEADRQLNNAKIRFEDDSLFRERVNDYKKYSRMEKRLLDKPKLTKAEELKLKTIRNDQRYITDRLRRNEFNDLMMLVYYKNN